MNMHSVFLHVLADALGSIVVIITALVVWLTDMPGKEYLDPAASTLLTLLIMFSTVPLVKRAAFVLLQGVPDNLNVDAMRDDLVQLDGIVDVHELHVWQLTDDKLIASLHVTCTEESDYMQTAQKLKGFFHNHGIHSTTIQPEFLKSTSEESLADETSCLLKCDPVQECGKKVCCSSEKEQMMRKRATPTTVVVNDDRITGVSV
eukprot:Colp12_sorted_trinity150504_noHs@20601